MKKKRFRICGWCGQVIESETKKQEKLLEHLEDATMTINIKENEEIILQK